MTLLGKFVRWARHRGRELLTIGKHVTEAKILSAKILIQYNNGRGLLGDIRAAESKFSLSSEKMASFNIWFIGWASNRGSGYSSSSGPSNTSKRMASFLS